MDITNALEMKPVTGYKEICINPHHAGFGAYQASEANGDAWADESDLESEIVGNGIDFLPLEEALKNPEYIAAGVENPTIYGDAGSIYASIESDPDGRQVVKYFGIIEVQVSPDYWD